MSQRVGPGDAVGRRPRTIAHGLQATMLCKLIIATLSVATALKLEAPAKPALMHKPLKLRGGADPTKIAKYIAYFTSGFMFLPAGRDVISPGAEIMPDDDKLIGKMFTDVSKDGYTFMWNQCAPPACCLCLLPRARLPIRRAVRGRWGTNWIALAIMKMLAISSGSVDFLKLGFATDVVTIGMMLKGWIPEFKPFMLLFLAETAALGKLAFS